MPVPSAGEGPPVRAACRRSAVGVTTATTRWVSNTTPLGAAPGTSCADPGYATVTPDVIQRRFLETPGQIITTNDTITVRLERRAYTPVLRKAALPATPVPWWGGRTLLFETT